MRTLQTVPGSHGHDPGLLTRDRAGGSPRYQAHSPRTRQMSRSHHTCLPPLFPGHMKKLQNPQQPPQRRCRSHTVSQTTRVTCRNGQNGSGVSSSRGETLPDGFATQTLHPHPHLGIAFPRGVQSHGLTVIWFCPPGPSERELPVPIGTGRGRGGDRVGGR